MSDLFTFDTDDDRRRHRRRRRRNPLGPVLAVVVVIALGIGVVYGARAIWRIAGSPPDYAGSGTGTAYVRVHDGDTAADIGSSLVSAGIVKSNRAFRTAAKSDSRSRSIQPGTYRLRHHMSGAAALAGILDPQSRVGRVTVPEGLRVTDTLAILSRHTSIPLSELTAVARHPDALGLPSYALGHLEGFLYPSTYDVPLKASATTVLKMMVSRFTNEHGEDDLTAHISGTTLTPQQVVIVASLLEKEGITSDFSKIARVVYNRLAAHKPLQLDSTINYALGRNRARVSTGQTRISSPYNTYQRTGLPPTPIADPGDAAIAAALHPASGDWLFFVKADRAGHSFFTADPKAFARQKARSQAEGVY